MYSSCLCRNGRKWFYIDTFQLKSFLIKQKKHKKIFYITLCNKKIIFIYKKMVNDSESLNQSHDYRNKK